MDGEGPILEEASRPQRFRCAPGVHCQRPVATMKTSLVASQCKGDCSKCSEKCIAPTAEFFLLCMADQAFLRKGQREGDETGRNWAGRFFGQKTGGFCNPPCFFFTPPPRPWHFWSMTPHVNCIFSLFWLVKDKWGDCMIFWFSGFCIFSFSGPGSPVRGQDPGWRHWGVACSRAPPFRWGFRRRMLQIETLEHPLTVTLPPPPRVGQIQPVRPADASLLFWNPLWHPLPTLWG